jgi:carbamoyl-phosphate synthase/aspartate carbamoyltransferase
MPDSVVAAARKAGIPVHQCSSLDEVLRDTDVLYVTRVQRERFEDLDEYERVRRAYVVDHALLARAKADMIVMHPLPRTEGEPYNFTRIVHKQDADALIPEEIAPEVDFDSRRAVYFRQMRYGLFVSG